MASAASSASTSVESASTEPPPKKMIKYLCLIRHGQGEHNQRNNPLALAFIPALFKRDAPLTGKGKRQAEALQQPMQSLPFDLILVSPLTRTIETATRAFEGHATPKRLCHLMCERATMKADEGTPKAALQQKHPHIAEWQGWDELPDHFWPARSLKTAAQEVASRIDEFKRWMLERPETCFALVGHSAFFKEMTGAESKLDNREAAWYMLSSDDMSVLPCPALPPPPSADE